MRSGRRHGAARPAPSRERDAIEDVLATRPGSTTVATIDDGADLGALAGPGAVRRRRRTPDPDPRRLRRARPELDSAVTRERIGAVDLVIGAGDLEPDYLSFVTDAFHAPLRYIRGNHDVGRPGATPAARCCRSRCATVGSWRRPGCRCSGFSGSPIYNERGMQVSALGMWAKRDRFLERRAASTPGHRGDPRATARR